MEIITQLFQILLATFCLAIIAFPKQTTPKMRPKMRSVGAAYWGSYQGCSCEDDEELKLIQVAEEAGKEKAVESFGAHKIIIDKYFPGQKS